MGEPKDWVWSETDMVMKIKNAVLWIRPHSDIENSAQAHMKKRQLFLKWCLTNMLTVAIIFLATAFGATQTQNLSLVGKAMVLAIVMIYFITTIYGGLISWRTDKVLDKLKGAADGQASGLHNQLS